MATNRPKFNVTKANIDIIDKRIMHSINIDTQYLAAALEQGPLNKTQGESLRAYAKFIRELKKEQESFLKELSDEELERKLKD